jgi:hypothetical protein
MGLLDKAAVLSGAAAPSHDSLLAKIQKKKSMNTR